MPPAPSPGWLASSGWLDGLKPAPPSGDLGPLQLAWLGDAVWELHQRLLRCRLPAKSQLLHADVVQVVKALYKAEKEIKGASRMLQVFSRKKMVKENVTIPYQTQAIKVYKELGLWTDAMDAVQAKVLAEAAK